MYARLIEEIAELRTFSEGAGIILVPVPITNKRLRERGYNQAELIAKGLMQNDKEKIFKLGKNIIVKTKDTLPQALIKNRNKRLKNVVGCFELKNNLLIKNKTIIVIDDVTTTGGTINEVIKLLKKAGAKKVVGFAVAH
jgi:competence protein ComFC